MKQDQNQENPITIIPNKTTPMHKHNHIETFTFWKTNNRRRGKMALGKLRKQMKPRWPKEGIIQLQQSLHVQGWYVELDSAHVSDPHALQ